MAEERQAEHPQGSGRRLAKHAARAALTISFFLCVAISICYTWRLDAWAAVTVFPIWLWPLAGIVLLAAARRQVRRRYSLTVALAWCLVLAVFRRSSVQPAPSTGKPR
ncbi:MAG: hypothetical protein B7Z73_19365 [Planctomycetia bacterium 21-64-5]|nr:MAG: hypothetical protein B7Z73_19365 [Planctomycetia bacterium 21-64-5]